MSPERLIKVWVDGFGDMDIIDAMLYVTAALEAFGRREVAFDTDPFYKGLSVKRVTIGDQTYHNPDWATERKDDVGV